MTLADQRHNSLRCYSREHRFTALVLQHLHVLLSIRLVQLMNISRVYELGVGVGTKIYRTRGSPGPQLGTCAVGESGLFF